MEINIPSVVAEVTAAFERYEKALNTNDVATLDELFWKSPHTLRYGVGEQLYGYDQIAAFRAGRDPGFVVKRDLLKLWIVTYGRDFGTANCEFRRHGANRSGRQSHTWMRTPEGWRIAAADRHVDVDRLVQREVGRRAGPLVIGGEAQPRDLGRVAEAAVGHHARDATLHQPRHQDRAGRGRTRVLAAVDDQHGAGRAILDRLALRM